MTQGKREDIIGPKVPSSKPITSSGEAAQAVDSVVPVLILSEIPRKELHSYILPRSRPLQSPLIN